MKVLAAAVAAMCVCAGGAASAASYTVDAAVRRADPDTGRASFTFDDFDNNLGILDRVEIRLDLSGSFKGLYRQPVPSYSHPESVSTTAEFDVIIPMYSVSDTVSASAFISPIDDATFNAETSASDALDLAVPDSVLGAFQGGTTDTYELGFVGRLNASLVNVGQHTADVAGRVAITYSYSPIPEPSTLAMLGAPLLGLVVGRRRAVAGAR